MKLGQRIILSFFMVILLFIIVLQVIINNQKRLVKEYVLNDSRHFEIVWQAAQNSQKEYLKLALEFVGRDARLKSLFLEKDREKLYQSAKPVLENLQAQHEIDVLNFILPSGIYFLRADNPDLHGDMADMPALTRLEQPGGFAGLTLDNDKFMLKALKPYYQDGNLVGYLELGQYVNTVIEKIKNVSKAKILLVVKKELIAKDKEQIIKTIRNEHEDAEQFKNYSILTNTLQKEYKSLLTDGLEKKIGFISRGLRVKNKIFKAKNHQFALCSFPLIDINGEGIGAVLGFLEITPYLATLAKTKSFALVMMLLLCIIVSVIGLTMMHAILAPIVKLTNTTKQIGKGNLNISFKGNLKDEIGILGQAFNKMVEDLKTTTTSIANLNKEINERKSAEDSLREYVDYMESIVETAQAIIIGFDQDLGIQSINAYAENLLGYKREEVIGKNWLKLLVQEKYREEIMQVLSNCLEGKRVNGYEMPVVTKKAEELMISWDSAELRDANGKISGILVMGYDLSQRKEIEKVQRLAQLGTLVSHMAHEVNNPLMVISGRAQLSLMEEINNDEVKANLDIVMKECQRAKDIIQRLLRFSRPSKGELKPTEVNSSIEEVVNLIEHQFGLDNIFIKKDYGENLPPVLVDEKQIDEVFMNLLTNALDAIGSEGSITIKTMVDEGAIKITFTDSGQGISKEVLDKIFDPFFTTKKKGTGLGLSICYSIIKAHNGDLRFESLAGQGTKAVIVLPYIQENKDVSDISS